MKRPIGIIAAVLGCALLALATVPGYYIYNIYNNHHKHPFGDFAERKEDFDALARIVEENRALIEQYPAAGVNGRLLGILSDGSIYIYASYPQNRYLPLTDGEKQTVASIASRYGGYSFLRVFDGGFLLMGDGESNLFSVLAHAENRSGLREMIPGELFERRIDELSDGWFCVYLRR